MERRIEGRRGIKKWMGEEKREEAKKTDGKFRQEQVERNGQA